MYKRARTILVMPLHIAMWSLVASAVVLSSFRKRDKPRQEKGGEELPPGYIIRVRREYAMLILPPDRTQQDNL
tara:strand:+ start:2165 stop:2383 length:219 start_codon:yes stop_codon:yes gene_type:complete